MVHWLILHSTRWRSTVCHLSRSILLLLLLLLLLKRMRCVLYRRWSSIDRNQLQSSAVLVHVDRLRRRRGMLIVMILHMPSWWLLVVLLLRRKLDVLHWPLTIDWLRMLRCL